MKTLEIVLSGTVVVTRKVILESISIPLQGGAITLKLRI